MLFRVLIHRSKHTESVSVHFRHDSTLLFEKKSQKMNNYFNFVQSLQYLAGWWIYLGTTLFTSYAVMEIVT